MSASKRAGAAIALSFVALVCACDDETKSSEAAPDGGLNPPVDAGTNATADAQATVDGQVPIDAQLPGDAGSAVDAAQPLQSCLPRPGELVRGPSVGLSCELIPPGLRL